MEHISSSKSVSRSLGRVVQGSYYFAISNFMLILLVGFFTYWTFFAGKLNWALLVMLVAFALMTICRVASYYRESLTNTLLYRVTLVVSASLLVTALGIQTLRFIYVFAPGLAKPTVAIILVRVGIATFCLYIYACLIAFAFYLFTSGLLNIFGGNSVRQSTANGVPKNRRKLHQVQFSANILIKIAFWGGLASILSLGVGFIAWLF